MNSLTDAALERPCPKGAADHDGAELEREPVVTA
jgi:hypothetical protein